MKKFILSLFVCVSMLFISTQKSRAAVGLIMGNPAISVVGGLAGLGGYVLVSESDTDDPGESFRRFFLGVISGIVGLTLLDGEQEAEIQFSPIHQSKNFSQHDLAIYNSELDELNAINQTITAEVVAHPKTADAQRLWEDYGQVLSPETMKVAIETSKQLLKALK